jgi:KDO2-lipid IV(A) lauroyltransferase
MIWAGKGGIYITAHFGNWELLGCIAPYIGLPVYAIARPIENPFVDSYLNKMRQITGQKIIPKKEAASGVMDILENGEFLSFLVDQNAGERGIFVDFFGKPASTTRTVALLSLKTGIPIIPVYGYRMKGFKYKVVIEDPIYPVDTGDPTADITSITQTLTRRVEEWVRMYPEQYLWQHRRWKTRPTWEKPGMLEVSEKGEIIGAVSS